MLFELPCHGHPQQPGSGRPQNARATSYLYRGSSSVLISTQLIGLVRAKIWTCVCDSLRVLMQISPLCLRKVEKGLLLSSLYSPVTLQCTAPLLLLKVIHAGGPSCIYDEVSLTVAAGMPQAWWQKGHSGTGIVVALLLAPELLSSPACPAQPCCHPRFYWHQGWVWGLSLHTQRLLPLTVLRIQESLSSVLPLQQWLIMLY